MATGRNEPNGHTNMKNGYGERGEAFFGQHSDANENNVQLDADESPQTIRKRDILTSHEEEKLNAHSKRHTATATGETLYCTMIACGTALVLNYMV